MRAPLALVFAAFAISACTSEVGSNAANPVFGEADQNNLFAQAIQFRGDAYFIEMRERFADETPDIVTFAFDRANLDRSARRALDEQAAWLRENTDVRVQVYGHTDLVGGESYNDKLGLRRARAVARYLRQKGIARSRIEAVESRGEREPIVQTEDRERRNRRTVTEVAGFTHGFIGDGMDGRRARLMYRRYVSDSVESPAGINTTSATDG